MTEDHGAGSPTGSASLHIAAPAEELYDLVADIAQMGRLSPECTGGRWLGSVKQPEVGARFVGFNKRGWFRWATINRVVTADPGREFAFETAQSGTRWRYRFEPDGDGTLVTEQREPWRDRPAMARLASRAFLGGIEEHDTEMNDGLHITLERLKGVAEREIAG